MPSHTRHNYRSCIDVSTLKSEVETIRVDVVSGIAYYNEHKGHKCLPRLCIVTLCRCKCMFKHNKTRNKTTPHRLSTSPPPISSYFISQLQLGKSVQILLKMSESLTLHVRNCSMHYSDDVMYMKHTTLNQLVYMDVGISNIT